MDLTIFTLTVVTSIFLPLQFITGVFGMNFDVMPELRYRYSYFIFWIAALIYVALVSCVIYRSHLTSGVGRLQHAYPAPPASHRSGAAGTFVGGGGPGSSRHHHPPGPSSFRGPPASVPERGPGRGRPPRSQQTSVPSSSLHQNEAAAARL
mmetsp:Transcript_5389/g.22261  ORF Transcript_5389/g.22261 Transcript_5389/m.22261 type:complete len:151 (-) Transcript_5389:137-589(-)